MAAQIENKTVTQTNFKVISYRITGSWLTSDFKDLLEAFEYLYLLCFYTGSSDKKSYTFIQLSDYGYDSIPVSDILYDYLLKPKKVDYKVIFNNYNLSKYPYQKTNINTNLKYYFCVKEINYASPGNVDLLGFGSIIQSVFDMIKHYIPNEQKKLENKILKQEIELKDMQILKGKLDLFKENNIFFRDKKSLIKNIKKSRNQIQKLIDEDKLVDIEIKSVQL